MKRVLVTGAAGMLGSELLRTAPGGATVVGTDLRADSGAPAAGFDLADAARVAELFRAHGPFDGVIHSAAYTAVDLAEDHEADAQRANETATRELARACARVNVPLVCVSTDFVFDGTGTRPYREDDTVSPVSAYGRTKLAGERAALAEHPRGARIVRTQWLYGPRGKHFPGTIVRLAREKGALKVVHDQVGSPTTTLALAPALWDVLARGEAGVYHAACAGQASWFELARATCDLVDLAHVPITPCTTAEFPRPARRPAYSVLDCAKLATLRGRALPHWRDALAAWIAVDRP